MDIEEIGKLLKSDKVESFLKKNGCLSLEKITARGRPGGLDTFFKQVEKDNFLRRLIVNAVNYGFEGDRAKYIKEVLDFYKKCHNAKVDFSRCANDYAKLKKAIDSAGYANDCGFFFKQKLLEHVQFAKKKAERLNDPEMEMYVTGLDVVLSSSIEELELLSASLDKVIDWSSKLALQNAVQILEKIKNWNNIRVVECMTSMCRMQGVTAPLTEAVTIAKQWMNSDLCVDKKNPRCNEVDLSVFHWENDQLRVWAGL